MPGSLQGAEGTAVNKIPGIMELTFKWGPQSEAKTTARCMICEAVTGEGKGRVRGGVWGGPLCGGPLGRPHSQHDCGTQTSEGEGASS